MDRNSDDNDKEEAAVGMPVLKLSDGPYRQITTFIYTQTHTTPQTHPAKCGCIFCAEAL